MNHEPESQLPIDEVKAIVNHLIDARTHWILIPDANGTQAVEEIHRRFYADASSDEFMEFAIVPADGIGGFVFFIADKQRLDASTLEAFLDTHPSPLQFRPFMDMSNVDLVVLADGEDKKKLIRNFIRCFAPKVSPGGNGQSH